MTSSRIIVRATAALVAALAGAAAWAEPCITCEVIYEDLPAVATLPAVFDPARDVTISVNTAAAIAAKTYRFDGLDWVEVVTAHAPPSAPVQLGGSLAYDRARAEVVYIISGQVWVFDGLDWTHKDTAPECAAGRGGAVYDEARGVVVTFGGSPTLGTYTNTMCEWDGVTLVKVIPPNLPNARSGHGMAYDVDRERVVIFAGFDAGGLRDDLWEFDGQTWSAVTPSNPKPSPRSDPLMSYDRRRGAMTLVGGQTANADVADFWEWSGASWRQRQMTNGPSTSVRRVGYVHEETTGAMLIAGGIYPTMRLNAPALPAVSGPLPQQVAAGGSASFTIVSNDSRALTFQWRKNGALIPGATGSGFAVLAAQAEDIALYDCIVGVADAPEGCVQIVAGPALLAVLPACDEDVDGDGAVDFADLNRVISIFNTPCVAP